MLSEASFWGQLTCGHDRTGNHLRTASNVTLENETVRKEILLLYDWFINSALSICKVCNAEECFDSILCQRILFIKHDHSWLTEHGVELLWVKVPLPPRGLVALGLCIVGMVELRLRPKWIQHSQHAPVTYRKRNTYTHIWKSNNWCRCERWPTSKITSSKHVYSFLNQWKPLTILYINAVQREWKC